MKKYRIILQIILPLLFAHLPVYASFSPHVFKIDARDCSSCPDKKAPSLQTGFLIKGKLEIKGKKPMSGIITALHGVVGRESIAAIGTEFSNLKIIAVDIEHDMALLSSDKLQKKQDEKQDGFTPSGQQASYKKIRCIGYPLGKDGQERKELIKIHGTESLSDRLGRMDAKFRALLNERRSPGTRIPVLMIEGDIVPGLSGAPILHDEDKVVGVVDGTVQIGNDIAWAIPLDEKIQWTDASDKKMVAEMERIAQLPTSALSSLTVQISRSRTLMLEKLRPGEAMSWTAAKKYAARMNREALEGCSDWRVPARVELEKIAQAIKKSPNSYTDTDNFYWSSEGIVSQAWAVHLGSGKNEMHSMRRKLYVWLVRNY